MLKTTTKIYTHATYNFVRNFDKLTESQSPPPHIWDISFKLVVRDLSSKIFSKNISYFKINIVCLHPRRFHAPEFGILAKWNNYSDVGNSFSCWTLHTAYYLIVMMIIIWFGYIVLYYLIEKFLATTEKIYYTLALLHSFVGIIALNKAPFDWFLLVVLIILYDFYDFYD